MKELLKLKKKSSEVSGAVKEKVCSPSVLSEKTKKQKTHLFFRGKVNIYVELLRCGRR